MSGEVSYQTVNSYVKRNFGAKIKVARRSHVKKDDESVDSFKKNFDLILGTSLSNAPERFSTFNLYAEDESRVGLFTRNGRSLTAKGVKPVCTYQNIFRSTYIFGAFSPYDGDSLVMEMPSYNGENFQIFLDELSRNRPEEFKVMVLDNGAFHTRQST